MTNDEAIQWHKSVMAQKSLTTSVKLWINGREIDMWEQEDGTWIAEVVGQSCYAMGDTVEETMEAAREVVGFLDSPEEYVDRQHPSTLTPTPTFTGDSETTEGGI